MQTGGSYADARGVIEALIHDTPLFTGHGDTPSFDLHTGIWESHYLVELNGKVRQLSDTFLGDYYLHRHGKSSGGTLLALPRAGITGRIGDVPIDTIMHSNKEEAIWFNTPDGQYFFASENSLYAYNPSDGKIQRYVLLDGAFLLKVNNFRSS